MKVLKRDVLKVGTYVKGGHKVTVTRDDVRSRFDSLIGLRRAGLHCPLLLEHTDPARQFGEGLPGEFDGKTFNYGDAQADELRRTVGAVDLSDPRSRINAQGGLDLVFDVPDKAAAKQLHDQRIRFVSPEMRPSWTDGKGNVHENVMTHVALTHKPIQVDQAAGFETISLSSTSTPVQLAAVDFENNFAHSVNDFDVCQFDGTFDDDDADSDPSRTPPNAPPPNPNMPKEKSTDEQTLEAINAHLQKLGIRLPEDTTTDDFMRSLLTALMTKVASDDKAASDAAAKGGDGDDDDSNLAEEKMPLTKQFSDDSAHGKLLARIQKLRKINALPAGMGDKMLIQLSSVEFDDKGVEKVSGGAIGVTQLCDMFEQQATQFSDGSPQARLIAEIEGARDRGYITPGEADQLKGRVGSIQFSDSGEERVAAGAVSVRQFLALSAKRGNVMGSIMGDATGGATATQFSDGDANGATQQFATGMEAAHPGGSEFTSGDGTLQLGDPRAKEHAESLLARTGMQRRKPKAGDSMLDQMNAQMSGAH